MLTKVKGCDMINIKKETMKKSWFVCLGAMVCCFLWGSAFPSIKVGYKLFEIGASDTAAQILFAGCRFFLAGIMTVIIGSVIQGTFLKPGKKSLSKICTIAMLQTVVQYFFFYVGLAHTTGVKASIVEASSVFAAIIISSLIFKQESLNSKKIAGCIIGFAGVVIINLTGVDMKFNFFGEGFILLSAISYAASSVFIKSYSKTENPVMLSGYQFILGGLIMMAGGYVSGGRLTAFSLSAGAILLYMAFISAVAYTIWGILLKYNPVSKVTVFGFMNPLFGVILSSVILGEGTAFDIKGVAALILVCVGIFVVNKE